MSLLNLSIPQIDAMRGYDEAIADIERECIQFVKDESEMFPGQLMETDEYINAFRLKLQELRKAYYEELQNENDKGLCK